MDNYFEKVCCMALGKAFGNEPRIPAELIRQFGSAKAVAGLEKNDLDDVLGPYSKTRQALGNLDIESAAKELDSLERYGSYYIGITEHGYPESLKDCEDPPCGLYVRASQPAEEIFPPDRTFISIVGTRNMTSYGKEWCTRIVQALASTGQRPVIVSGLAYGVDITAHREALALGIPTMACMATGIDSIYPWRHIPVAEQIEKSDGSALITDFPTGSMPLKSSFLRRNRIIAGLSGATVLIESKEKGGGMVTSNLAFSYGRDVYALPGRADDVCSAGCNRLITARIAEPIFNELQFLESIGLPAEGFRYRRKSDPSEIIMQKYGPGGDSSGVLTSVLGLISKSGGITVEEISERLSLEYKDASSATAMLESDGLISIDLRGGCSAIFH